MSMYLAFKDLVSLAQKSGNLDLLRHLLDVQSQALDQQDELYELRQEVARLKQKLVEVGEVEVFHGVYWRRLSDDKLDGPYSPHCWDMDKVLVRMPYYGTDSYSRGVAHHFCCLKSKQSYYVPVEFYSNRKINNGDELPTTPYDR